MPVQLHEEISVGVRVHHWISSFLPRSGELEYHADLFDVCSDTIGAKAELGDNQAVKVVIVKRELNKGQGQPPSIGIGRASTFSMRAKREPPPAMGRGFQRNLANERRHVVDAQSVPTKFIARPKRSGEAQTQPCSSSSDKKIISGTKNIADEIGTILKLHCLHSTFPKRERANGT
ncbi:uncharacterized protein BDZ99DRAFT_527610 [Mytilinidion resinicola]|uniref:Uncharacterized protein n=1 Tax=Mytilinidion resinicola TaxID=574789 RepID=A0A6A6Y0R5_9PEZI|nr:uncharacterized protein BDZ99DRAFT_527610 [Mytilinidion resinicola]KAF2802239.1 hypothetical protein BDZ99DRAFT_527610 [Mytilinidion resinicola]